VRRVALVVRVARLPRRESLQLFWFTALRKRCLPPRYRSVVWTETWQSKNWAMGVSLSSLQEGHCMGAVAERTRRKPWKLPTVSISEGNHHSVSQDLQDPQGDMWRSSASFAHHP
jgi:hypothetical protein